MVGLHTSTLTQNSTLILQEGGGGLGIEATHIARTWIVLSVTGFFSYLDAVFRYSIAWIYFLSACSTLPAAEQNDGER